jgi:capsular exopolysaccharide synthesis family protein
MKALKETLSHMPEIIVKEEMTGGAMSASDEMRKKYNALLTKEKELLSTFNDSSIPVLETKNQIRAVKELLEKTEENLQIKRGLNDNQQKLKLDLANEEALWISCRAKLNVLKTQLEKAREELKVINNTELQLVNLEREKEIQTANYRNYSESLEQTRIDNELEVDKISNIGITQKPTYPLKPYRPRVLINLLLGLFFGISGGLGLAFFCDYLDHTLKNPEEIEKKLQIYSLGFVPALFADSVSKKEKHLEVPVIFNAESRIMKACEICADRFLDLTKKELKKFRILSITSCHRNEGCSTVSAYFAASLADHGEGRVLLVDANLQNPIQHRIFGINTSQGLSDILIQGQGKTSFIHRSSYDNLDLLCAGGSEIIGKKRLFESKTFTDLLNYWKNEYSYIVLDTPSVSAENHAVSLGNAADGIIMVISADETRLEVAHRAIERMTKSGSSIIGGILNKRRYYVPSWLYKTLT